MFDISLGIDGEINGYDNIRLRGLVLGLTTSEIEERLPDIVEFTELGDFLKVPVRTYSNGMMMRLAFAIATVRDPEILLIDEVIGVGDAGFVKKAFARLLQLVERSRILIVAAHQDATLRRLCNKAAWLDHGSLMAYGEFEGVISAYRNPNTPAQQAATA